MTVEQRCPKCQESISEVRSEVVSERAVGSWVEAAEVLYTYRPCGHQRIVTMPPRDEDAW